MIRTATLPLLVVLASANVAAAEEIDPEKMLLRDLVTVFDGKMKFTEYGLLDVRGKRFQVAWKAEAPATGVISRDSFVGLVAAVQHTLLFAMAAGEESIQAKDLGDAYEYEELESLIGNADVTVSLYVTKQGLQIEFVGNKTGRITLTWHEFFNPKKKAGGGRERFRYQLKSNTSGFPSLPRH